DASSKASDLRIVAYTSNGERPYHKVSDHVSTQVLSTREAVLARRAQSDLRSPTAEALSDMQARSVICAPIQLESLIHGVVHLYSTDAGKSFEREDLEFTIAVADQLAVALTSLKEKESLAKGLARIRDDYETLRQQLAGESEIVGDSPEVHSLRETITRIA